MHVENLKLFWNQLCRTCIWH